MGKQVLVVFETNGRQEAMGGEVISESDLFLELQTPHNVVKIPMNRIVKIKEKLSQGERDEF